MKKNLTKILFSFLLIFMTAWNAKAQYGTYNPAEIEQLKTFLRQKPGTQTNAQRLGLDTLSPNWNTQTAWIATVPGLNFVNVSGTDYIQKMLWASKSLGGTFNFTNLGQVTQIDLQSNSLTGISLSLCPLLLTLSGDNSPLLTTVTFGVCAKLKDLSFSNCPTLPTIATVTVTNLPDLTNYVVKNSPLYTSNNVRDFTKLDSIDLSGTAINALNVGSTANIRYVNISNCPNIKNFDPAGRTKLTHVIAANCPQLSMMNMSSANPVLKVLNVSNCLFVDKLVGVNLCKNLEELYISNNPIAGINVSTNPKLRIFNCSYDMFRFSTMPYVDTLPGMQTAGHLFTYAPQRDIDMGTVSQNGSVPLAAEYNILRNGVTHTSVFNWFEVNGSTETPVSSGITNTAGVITFDASMANKTLRCKMTNAHYPDLTMIYTVKVAAFNPTYPYVVGEIDALKAFLRCPGKTEGKLNVDEIPIDTTNWNSSVTWVASIPGLTFVDLYGEKSIQVINWNGPAAAKNFGGDLSIDNWLQLKTLTFTSTQIKTISVSDCPILTFAVFSTGAELLSFTASDSPLLNTVTLSNSAKLANVSFTNCPVLKTISLEKMAATSLNVSNLPTLETLTLNEAPNLTTITFGENTGLKKIYLNKTVALTNINVLSLSALTEFYGTDAKLDKVDFTGLPNLDQVDLSRTPVSEIKVNNCPKLRVIRNPDGGKLPTINISTTPSLILFDVKNNLFTAVDFSAHTGIANTMSNISGNNLRFSTMTGVKNAITYAPQDTIFGANHPFDATLDLSAEYTVQGVTTVFSWFEVTGTTETPLTSGVNVVANGKFTFAKALMGKILRCKMTNTTYPALTLIYQAQIIGSSPCTPPENLAASIHNPEWYNVELSWSSPQSPTTLLTDNGSFVTHPGAGANGADASKAYVLMGGNVKKTHYMVATDDFTLTAPTNIDYLDVYAFPYQKPSLTSPFTESYVFICSGEPGTPECDTIWGDWTTNRFVSSEFANAYCITTEDLTSNQNPIFSVRSAIHTTLPAGTYWVCVSVDGSSAPTILSAPANPATSPSGNAMIGSVQMGFTNWSQWPVFNELGTEFHANFPFKLYGSTVPEGLVGYNVYRDDVKQNTTPVPTASYLDYAPVAGNFQYKVTAVWDDDCESTPATISVNMPMNPCDHAITSFPYKEGFEEQNGDNTSSLPLCWTQEHVVGTTTWNRVAGGGGFPSQVLPIYTHTGNYKMTFQNYTSAGGWGSTTKAISPKFDLSSLSHPVLKFWHVQKERAAGNEVSEHLTVYYKNSPTGAWLKIDEKTTPVSMWTERIVELPNPTSTYWIAFEGMVMYGDGLQIDDICITDALSNITPTNVVAVVNQQTVNLSWNNPAQTISGYVIYRDTMLVATVTTNSFSDKNVTLGTYKYCVTAYKNSADTISAPVFVNATVTEIAKPDTVNNLNVVMANNKKYVDLTWTIPTEHNSIFGYGHDIVTSVGTGNTADINAAARFDLTDIKNLSLIGRNLTKIRFVPFVAPNLCSYRIRVWVGGTTTTPGMLIVDQEVNQVIPMAWNEIALTTPLLIDGAEPIWIGYQANTTTGYPVGADAGPAFIRKGNLMSVNNQWQATMNSNWCIEGIAEGNGKVAKMTYLPQEISQRPTFGEVHQLEIPFAMPLQAKSIVSLEQENNVVKTVSQQVATDAVKAQAALKYNVYRDGVLLTTTSNLYYSDYDLKQGLHNYCVTAFYNADFESEESCRSVEVVLGVRYNEKLSFYPNPASSQITISEPNIIRLEIYSLAGSLVETITSGFNRIDVAAYKPGAYLCKAYKANGETLTQRLIIAR